MKEIEIYGDYIQLDQFLKKENIISSGGGTGDFIKKHEIFEWKHYSGKKKKNPSWR